MKNLNTLLLSILCIAVLASCDKGELGPVASSNPGSPSITSPESGGSYTLQEEQAEDTLLTMEWNNPDYGFSSAPSATIEMAETGTDFADPIQLATVNGTSYSIVVGDFNGTMLGAGYSGGQQISMDVRVLSTISDTTNQQVSDPVTLTFTPYSICNYCPEIYVPGGYQSASGYTADWSPADAPPLATVDGSDVYDGYVYIANGGSQFKFTAERNWNNGDWGDDGADGSLDSGGANIQAANAGYYKINVDLNSLTYSMTDTQWGLIGDATANGWNSDQDMTYDSANKVWTITDNLSAGAIKFRANDAWDINYGDTGADGSLEQDGDNISISSAGNYTIELDLSSSPYTYTITQN